MDTVGAETTRERNFLRLLLPNLVRGNSVIPETFDIVSPILNTLAPILLYGNFFTAIFRTLLAY